MANVSGVLPFCLAGLPLKSSWCRKISAKGLAVSLSLLTLFPPTPIIPFCKRAVLPIIWAKSYILCWSVNFICLGLVRTGMARKVEEHFLSSFAQLSPRFERTYARWKRANRNSPASIVYFWSHRCVYFLPLGWHDWAECQPAEAIVCQTGSCMPGMEGYTCGKIFCNWVQYSRAWGSSESCPGQGGEVSVNLGEKYAVFHKVTPSTGFHKVLHDNFHYVSLRPKGVVPIVKVALHLFLVIKAINVMWYHNMAVGAGPI